MSSDIFAQDGPSPVSMYAPGRQQEIYDSLKPTLGTAKRPAPDMNLPKAGDIKCTQLRGNAGAVLPTGGSEARGEELRAGGARQSGADVLVYSKEAFPVVHNLAKDDHIPKEFWATSVQLAWSDPRNERCRPATQGSRQGLDARQLRHAEMSSEIFGKDRLLTSSSPSTSRHELLSESTDFLQVDSALHSRRVAATGHKVRSGEEVAAKVRAQDNLAKSANNTMASGLRDYSSEASAQKPSEDVTRRRQERNYSDLFGQPGAPPPKPARADFLATTNTCFLDPRAEIAARNQEKWRFDAADDRPENAAEQATGLRDLSSSRPLMTATEENVRRGERCAWPGTDAMDISVEVARRRSMRDHLRDFKCEEGENHRTRFQQNIGSAQIRQNLNVQAAPGCDQPAVSSRLGRPVPMKFGPSPDEREEMLRSARGTKNASLQSHIFSRDVAVVTGYCAH